MLERLVEYVSEASDDEISQLLAQDIAICQTWIEASVDVESLQERFQTIPKKIAQWQQSNTPSDQETEGRRHEIVTRLLVDALESDKHQELHRDENAYLCALYKILQRVHNPDQHARCIDKLEPHFHILEKRRSTAQPVAHLPGLSKKIQYTTEKDIAGAPVRDSRLLAGIELPCRGPVVSYSTNLRVIGDVPEESTVVLKEDGHCCVDGYLMGRVLAKQSVEIRGNISGVAIVLHGDVRARSIINNAHVVAKMGSVLCRAAQGPKLLFAAKRISVIESTMLGNFISRVMDVGDEVRGGQIQVSDLASAAYFRHLGTNNLAVVLRRELSCEDFGEVTGAELKHLLSEAYRLRRAAINLESLADMALAEVEHSAQTVLMYLFGGGKNAKKLEEIVSARNRQNIIKRIIRNLQDVLERAQCGLISALSLDSANGAAEDAFTVADSDSRIDPDLVKESEDALRLQRKLNSRKLDRNQTSVIVDEATEKLEFLERESATLEIKIVQDEKNIQSLQQYERLLAGSQSSASKRSILKNALPKLRKQSTDSGIGARLEGAFVTRALNTIDRRTNYANECAQKAVQNRKDFRAVSDRLGKDFQIRVLENPESDDNAARVTGRFEAGVQIFMEVRMPDSGAQPEGSIVTTPEGDEIRTYIRANRGGARFHSRA